MRPPAQMITCSTNTIPPLCHADSLKGAECAIGDSVVDQIVRQADGSCEAVPTLIAFHHVYLHMQK
jgi:hypothetical protein